MATRIFSRLQRNRDTSSSRRGRRPFRPNPEALEQRSLLSSLSIANAAALDGTSGTTPMVFKVSLSAASTQPVSVGYTTVGNGTAAPGVDYLNSIGTLTFAPGQTIRSITVQAVGQPAIGLEKTFTVVLSNPTNATITQRQAAGIILLNAASMCIAPNGVVYALQANGDLYNASSDTEIATNVKSFAIRNDSNVYVLQQNNNLYLYTPSRNYEFGIVKGFALRNDGNGYVWFENGDLIVNAPSQDYDFGVVKGFALRNDGNGYVWFENGDLIVNAPSQDYDFGIVKGFALRNDGNGYVWFENGDLIVNTPAADYDIGTVQAFALRNDGNGYAWFENGDLIVNAPSQDYDFGTVKDFALRNDGNGYAWFENGDLIVNAPSQDYDFGTVKDFALRNDGNGYIWYQNDDLILNTSSQNYNFGTVQGFALRNDGNGYVWYQNDELYLNTPALNIDLGNAKGFGLRNDGNGYVWYQNDDLILNTPSQNYNFGTVQGFALRNDGNGYVWYQNDELYLNTPTQNIDLGNAKAFALRSDGNGYIWYQNNDLIVNSPAWDYDFGPGYGPIQEFLVDVSGNGYFLTVSGNLYENTPASNTLVDQNVYSFSFAHSGELNVSFFTPPASAASTNWSGYVAEPSLTQPQTNSVFAVFGAWKVPTVSGPSWTASNSCVWVGIDGYGGSTVEQIGTAQDVLGYPGAPTAYYAWFEMWSAGTKQPQQMITNMTISPGDSIYAWVQYMNAGPHAGQFYLAIDDTSRAGDSFATYRNSAQTQNPQAQRDCAEWIVENPTVNGSLGSLAKFGTVAFTETQAAINGQLGGIDSPAWDSARVNMVSSSGTEASTSSLINTTENGSTSTSFTVSFVSSAGASVRMGAAIGVIPAGLSGGTGAFDSSPLPNASLPPRRDVPIQSNSQRVVVNGPAGAIRRTACQRLLGIARGIARHPSF